MEIAGTKILVTGGAGLVGSHIVDMEDEAQSRVIDVVLDAVSA